MYTRYYKPHKPLSECCSYYKLYVFLTKGTSIGGNDMVAFFSVGVVNHVVLPNLRLQSGQVYYATIKGQKM
jgi:hypothetical protein